MFDQLKTEDIDTALLPKRIAELATVIGLDSAMLLVKHYGGTSIWPPKTAAKDHPLADVIGMEAFIKLCAYYGADIVEIDCCTRALRAVRQKQIVDEHQRGVTNRELARRYGYSERGIRKLLKRVKLPPGL